MMKLFETSQGFIFSFGFNMLTRKRDAHCIAWCDPVSKEWETASSNQAGFIITEVAVDPQFIHEIRGGLVAYQPGLCLELMLCDLPYVFNYTVLTPDQFEARKAA